MSITHGHIMTEQERMDYLTQRAKQQAPMQVWSPPALTKEEKEAQKAYIKEHGCKF